MLCAGMKPDLVPSMVACIAVVGGVYTFLAVALARAARSGRRWRRLILPAAILVVAGLIMIAWMVRVAIFEIYSKSELVAALVSGGVFIVTPFVCRAGSFSFMKEQTPGGASRVRRVVELFVLAGGILLGMLLVWMGILILVLL
jgi:glucose-6-phosphate-specific signal transduction histidine kinase